MTASSCVSRRWVKSEFGLWRDYMARQLAGQSCDAPCELPTDLDAVLFSHISWGDVYSFSLTCRRWATAAASLVHMRLETQRHGLTTWTQYPNLRHGLATGVFDDMIVGQPIVQRTYAEIEYSRGLVLTWMIWSADLTMCSRGIGGSHVSIITEYIGDSAHSVDAILAFEGILVRLCDISRIRHPKVPLYTGVYDDLAAVIEWAATWDSQRHYVPDVRRRPREVFSQFPGLYQW